MSYYAKKYSVALVPMELAAFTSRKVSSVLIDIHIGFINILKFKEISKKFFDMDGKKNKKHLWWFDTPNMA